MKPYVTFELDKPRRLRYGINALCMLEDVLGKPLAKLDTGDLAMKDLRAIIYCGLVNDDKSLTPEVVGDLIDDYSNLNEALAKMNEAFTISLGNVTRATGEN